MEGSTETTVDRWYSICAIVFFIMIAAAAIGSVILPDKAFSATENRNLTELKDALSWQNLKNGTIDEEVEQYTADQFPIRNQWMQLRSGLDFLRGVNLSQGVYGCRDTDWEGTRVDYLMEQYSEPDKTNQEETFSAIKQFAKTYTGSRVYMLLAPNAVSIYPERLPAYAVNADQNQYIDALYQYIEGDVTCIDIRPEFLASKNDIPLYYRTDHHWTSEGAWLAYQQLAKAMKLEDIIEYSKGVVCNHFVGSLAHKSGFTPVRADSISIYRPQIKEDIKDSLYYTLTYEDRSMSASCYDLEALNGPDPYQVFFGGNHSEFILNTSADTENTLLIIKDSYANCVIPFFIPYYTKIKVIDPRYYSEDLNMDMLVNEYSDVLFLYNVNTLSQDTALKLVVQGQ